jgi:short-subunit dehydrogenase
MNKITAADRKTALVTGASSGIGVELARIHAEHGGDLIVVARRQERLESLKTELEKAHGVAVHVLPRDLSRSEAPQQVYDEVRSRGLRVDYLMNNAGFGHRGFFHELDWAMNEAMIEVNIVALAALTRLFLPQMIERGGGRILNVGSMAGFLPGPLHAVYYASKAFVISFSEALANELAGTGVRVTVLCPGPTETEFFQRAQMQDLGFLTKTPSARKIAEVGYKAMLAGKTVVVPGLLNKLMIHALLRLSPRGLTTRISRAQMERRARKQD